MRRVLWTITAVLLLASAPAWSADFGQAAKETAADLSLAKHELAATRQKIAHERAAMKARLADLSAKLAAEKKALAAAREGLAQASRDKAELGRQLAETSGDLKELAGHVRAGARELLAVAERSPSTAQEPGRLEELRDYLNKSRFPGLADIQNLVEKFFGEMAASGQIARWRGPLVDRQGRETPADIVRLGSFTTLYRTGGELGFATLGPASGRLLAAGGKPSWLMSGDIAAYLDRETQAAPMDISGGAALRQLSRGESAWERLLAGGPLVWPILAVALAALILIIERLVFLQRVRANTDQMMASVAEEVAGGDFAAALEEVEKQPGRPTSNVLAAGLAPRGQAAEGMGAGLSGAMLRGLPPLEP
ncbi:MAG: hypothetical protein K9L18_16140, partial [Desulfarculaceae bacterium]|nr:hypothetical protein [Desulfarculaceae bacterium]